MRLDRDTYLACCGSHRWADAMDARGEFADADAMMAAADDVWANLDEADYLEAFRAHPRIGANKASAWSKQEQAGAASADDATRAELAALNDDYYDRFGFIFIICATGKSAGEMLAALRARVASDRDAEIAAAAEQQRQITRIRLAKALAT